MVCGTRMREKEKTLFFLLLLVYAIFKRENVDIKEPRALFFQIIV